MSVYPSQLFIHLFSYTSLCQQIHSSVYLCSVSLLARGLFTLPRKQDNILLVGGLAEPCCSLSIFMTERCGRNCFHTPSHFMSSSSSSNYLSIHPSVHLSIVPADQWVFTILKVHFMTASSVSNSISYGSSMSFIT